MQYKLGYLWKGKGACNYVVVVAAQVRDDTVTGDGGEHFRPGDLKELGDDSIE